VCVCVCVYIYIYILQDSMCQVVNYPGVSTGDKILSIVFSYRVEYIVQVKYKTQLQYYNIMSQTISRSCNVV